MAKTFVSAPLTAGTTRWFTWGERSLRIASIERTWRSTNLDRGDTYLARHWYEVQLEDGALAVIYFDRKARGRTPHWWLYTIDE